MEYKAYYNFSATAEGDIEELYFDFVNVGSYVFDVHDADGFDWNGKDCDCSGTFDFTCEVDGDEEEIDWSTFDEDLKDVEAVFSLFDENGKPLDFDNSKFDFYIYDDDGNKHAGSTTVVMCGNI